jgi:hypothetical protein
MSMEGTCGKKAGNKKGSDRYQRKKEKRTECEH